jgi:hypothetical protein
MLLLCGLNRAVSKAARKAECGLVKIQESELRQKTKRGNDQQTSVQQKKFYDGPCSYKGTCRCKKRKCPTERLERRARVMLYLRIDAMNAEGEYDILR